MSLEDKTFLLGVGAQKAGTTWLHRYLMQHPDVYMSPLKELHYFDTKEPRKSEAVRSRLAEVRAKALRASKTGRAERLAARLGVVDDKSYRNYFETQTPDRAKMFGEITPAYAHLPEAEFRSIRALFPSVRIIFILRDPVKRMASEIGMHKKLGRPGKARVDDDRTLRRAMNPESPLRLAYEETITRLESVFAEDELIYLFYETLFRQETIDALCARLGISEQPADFTAVYAAASHHADTARETAENARAGFQSTYEFCRRKFGSALPAEWSAD